MITTMPFQPKLDFVGVSASQLPFVHGSFPAGGVLVSNATSTRNVSQDSGRSQSLLNEKSPLQHMNSKTGDFKLPKIDLKVDHPLDRRSYFDQSTRISGNIYRQKQFYRLKGIPFNSVFSVHRAKSPDDNQLSNPKQKKQKNSKRKPSRNGSGKMSSHTFPISSFKFPPIGQPDKAMSVISPDKDAATTTDAVSETSDDSDKVHKSRLREMDRASPVQGMRAKKKKTGRKLGNVVTSKRLNQLLTSEDNMAGMNGFFFY